MDYNAIGGPESSCHRLKYSASMHPQLHVEDKRSRCSHGSCGGGLYRAVVSIDLSFISASDSKIREITY
jgi:hypothetical protein